MPGRLQRGQPEVLLAVLPRAIDVAALLAPQGWLHAGLVLALDQLGEYFGDKWAAVEFIPTVALPQGSGRGQGAAANQAGLFKAFASAAEAGGRPELAARFLVMARGAASPPGASDEAAVEHARLLAWLSRLSADGGACARAYVVADDLWQTTGVDEESDALWRPLAVALQGRALAALGEYERARTLLERSLGMRDLPDGVSWRVDALVDLYVACLGTGDKAKARECHRRLTAVGLHGATSQAEVEAVAVEEADPARAAALLQEALGGEGRGLSLPALLRVALRLLRLQIGQGDAATATALYSSLVTAAEHVDPDHPLLSELDEVGAALLQADDPDKALRLLFRATARDVRCAPQLLAIGSARSRARILNRFRRRTEGAAALLIARFPANRRYVGGVHALVLRQKGLNTALEWQAARQEAAAPTQAQELARVRADLAGARSNLAAALLDQWRSGGAEGPAARLLEVSEDLEWEASRLLHGLRVREVGEVPNPLSIGIGLPENSVYLDYYACRPLPAGAPAPDHRYAAFVLRSGISTDLRVVDLGDAHEIDDLLDRYRAEILGRDRPPGNGEESPGELLWQRLVDPVLPHLDGRTRLVICPDRALFTLPWECLPDGSGGYLIDRFCVSYVYTSRSATYSSEGVIHAAAERNSVAAPVVVGAPDYGAPSVPSLRGSGALRFTHLPAAAQEAADVAEALGVHPALGADAVKAVLQDAHDPLVVHLATHGFVLPSTTAEGALTDVPLLRAGLAMADANASPTGVLTGAEVLSLQLGNTALVVLSACDTGLGVMQEGEGVASLGRAFDTAGASAVVTALWTVPDWATNELMLRFYAQLLRGQGCAEALRQAKLDVRAHSSEVLRWGAFVSTGRWGSIAVRAWSRV